MKMILAGYLWKYSVFPTQSLPSNEIHFTKAAYKETAKRSQPNDISWVCNLNSKGITTELLEVTDALSCDLFSHDSSQDQKNPEPQFLDYGKAASECCAKSAMTYRVWEMEQKIMPLLHTHKVL